MMFPTQDNKKNNELFNENINPQKTKDSTNEQKPSTPCTKVSELEISALPSEYESLKGETVPMSENQELNFLASQMAFAKGANTESYPVPQYGSLNPATATSRSDATYRLEILEQMQENQGNKSSST